MKKILIATIVMLFVLTLSGCSKKTEEPSLNLVYDGYTSVAKLVEYTLDGDQTSYDSVPGINYLKVKLNASMQYNATPSPITCTLQIRNADSNKLVKELTIDSTIETGVPQGTYLYHFTVEWENGTATFIQPIQIL